MDNTILNLIKDGSSYVVLIIIVWYWLSKWIPFAINKFGEILREQNDTYKGSLEKITSSFTTYVEKSMSWHEKHSEQLNRVENKIDNLK